MDAPRALVIRTAGTNCDAELVRAFALAGAAPELVHLDALSADPASMGAYDLIGLPGGFSYGDDIASGRIKAAYIRQSIGAELRAAADRGAAIIGICNGFQVLVQLGMLPGFGGDPSVALCENDGGRFVDDWARLEVNERSDCVWTKGLLGIDPEHREIPYAHGEGRLVCRDAETLERMRGGAHDALRTTRDINGSADRICGLCDASGRVFGLMPHPERALEWNRHPSWSRLPEPVRSGPTPGLAMFRGAVGSVAGSATVSGRGG